MYMAVEIIRNGKYVFNFLANQNVVFGRVLIFDFRFCSKLDREDFEILSKLKIRRTEKRIMTSSIMSHTDLVSFSI